MIEIGYNHTNIYVVCRYIGEETVLMTIPASTIFSAIVFLSGKSPNICVTIADNGWELILQDHRATLVRKKSQLEEPVATLLVYDVTEALLKYVEGV